MFERKRGERESNGMRYAFFIYEWTINDFDEQFTSLPPLASLYSYTTYSWIPANDKPPGAREARRMMQCH